MNRLTRFVAFLAPLAVATFAALPASADSVSIDAECTFQTGVECEAYCKNPQFDAKCDVDLAASCQGSCQGSVEASCTGSCEADCSGKCSADPGNFDCSGSCTADCSGGCDAECSASTNGASSKADCVGKCQASCNARCDAKCTGTPPSATCDAKCQASCQGSCSAQANLQCDVNCEASGHADCVVNAKADCGGHCTSSGGVLVCNGQAQALLDDINAARAWLASHVVVHASSGSSCSGNGCEAHAEAEATTKCSATPGQTEGGGVLALAGLAALGAVISRRRRG